MKIVFAVCGSFCNHAKTLEVLESLVNEGNDITPVISEIVRDSDTRFGTKEAFKTRIEELCGKKVISTIKDAEELLTPQKFDLLLICPCTGNTLAKIANSITDTSVTMTAKIFFRNIFHKFCDQEQQLHLYLYFYALNDQHLA